MPCAQVHEQRALLRGHGVRGHALRGDRQLPPRVREEGGRGLLRGRRLRDGLRVPGQRVHGPRPGGRPVR